MALGGFLKKTIKNILWNKGYHLLRRYYYDFGSDESIKKILNSANRGFDDLIIFDVGANVGQSVDRFRRYSAQAKIYSFEPNPNVYALLEKKMQQDQNLKTFNFGIGNENGELTFYIQPDSGSSSFYKVNTSGDAFELSNTDEAKKNHNITTLKQDIGLNTGIKVPVRTIESVVKELNVDKIDILKIDTQGYEENVLEGCGEILKNILIVEAEVIFSDSYENSSSLKGLQGILEKYGFVMWDIPYIGKFATDKVNRINFVDVLFVNRAIMN